ncbi:MAG: DUF4623 domain-containing protein [Prevotella sp.]|nr:DUF4623 domain-containing protein [Prevotella sp.]
MKRIRKYIGMFIIPYCVMMIIAASCKNEEAYDESPDLTVIYGIKIVNVGEHGDKILEGMIDELSKEITFPYIDTLTDFSKIRFEATLPERAFLDESVYDFSMDGSSRIKRTIAVVNGARKREYYVTLLKDIPLFGADFDSKIKVYNFSNSGTIYPDFSAGLTRSADMDADYVLVVSRATFPHLLRLSDLKQGKTDSPVALDLTGIGTSSPPTFPVSAGRLSHGHIYISSLSVLGNGEELNIYHWATPASKPEKIGSFSKGMDGIPDYPASGGRFGDCISVNLDENGNGYIFLGNNRGTVAADPYVLRLTVSGFDDISDPALINLSVYGGWWTSYNQVDGSANEYIYTGYQAPIMLVNESGSDIYTMATASVPLQGNDARIVNFNGERYLVMTTSTQGTAAATLYVYDISKGSTVEEALELFEATTKMPKYSLALGGAAVASVYAANLSVAKTEDALYLMSAAPGAGFVVVEAPKATKDE